MSRQFGVPYKGSKSRIAANIIECLPPAKTFVDLFAGGCAVTHAAMVSRKYEQFIVNDVDGRGVRLFKDAMDGKYKTIPDKWVSREDFFRNRALPTAEQDAYIAICWSFGNDMDTYLYGAEIEEWKHAYHEAVFHRDLSLWKAQGFDAPEIEENDVEKRRLFYQRYIAQCMRGGQEQRLQTIERAMSISDMGGYGKHRYELETAERSSRISIPSIETTIKHPAKFGGGTGFSTKKRLETSERSVFLENAQRGACQELVGSKYRKGDVFFGYGLSRGSPTR